MRRIGVLIAAIVAWPGPTPIAAQSFEPSPRISRLAWGTLDILILADTLTGLRIWAIPRNEIRDISGRFDPIEVRQWLDLARTVVAQPAVPDTGAYLFTPPLISRDSAMVVLYRERSGEAWSRRSFLLFTGTGQKDRFTVPLEPRYLEEFLSAVSVQAAASRLVPDRDTTAVPQYCTTCAQDTASAPRMLKAGRRRYPPALQARGMEGRVWATFVITPTGLMDPESFRVLLSDHPLFAKAAWEMLRESTFRPWLKDGVPTAVEVFQKVNFTF